MEEKEVMVAVLTHKDKLLVMKRAENSRYDPGRWEFVSMMTRKEDIPRTLEEQIHAETGLRPILRKKGKPFKVSDEYGKWIVRPFLFETESVAVNLDSDHTEHKWIQKAELKKLETVKDLDKNLIALL